MCFSAAASLTATGVLLVLGLFSLTLVFYRSPDDARAAQKLALATFAAIPLIFALHQLSEGFVWLDSDNIAAVRFFSYTAYSVWPFYISVSTACVEWTRQQSQTTNRAGSQVEGGDSLVGRFCCSPVRCSVMTRKRLLLLNSILGLVLFGVVVAELQDNEPLYVNIENGRLGYLGWTFEEEVSYMATALYIYVVVGSLLTSSLKYASWFGWAVLIACAVTLLLWRAQFPSTWCFFAAILSSAVVIIVWYELEDSRLAAVPPEEHDGAMPGGDKGKDRGEGYGHDDVV